MEFIKNNLEKSERLVQILEFINTNEELKGKLILKGGTAINQLFFDYARISYDIDLDYSQNISPEEIPIIKENIENIIINYMSLNNYELCLRGKKTHILTSLIFSFITKSGSKDNIKLDINYIDRCHIYPPQYLKINNRLFKSDIPILTLDTNEIFGSKLNALLDRGMSRDLYDIYTLINSNLDVDYQKIIDCYIFYHLLTIADDPLDYDFNNIEKFNYHKFKIELKPQLEKSNKFNLDEAKQVVKSKLESLLIRTPKRELYINNFLNGLYTPNILFSNLDLVEHPMAKWRMKQMADKLEKI